MSDWSLKQSLLWAQVNQLTFNIFDKVDKVFLIFLFYYVTLRLPMFNDMVYSIIEPWYGLMCHTINCPFVN